MVSKVVSISVMIRAHNPSYLSIFLTCSTALRGCRQGISALDIEPSGARLASGARDYEVHLHDFNGMHKPDYEWFRNIEPCPGHFVCAARLP